MEHHKTNPARAKREKGEGRRVGKVCKILALIAVVVIAALTLVGEQIKTVFNNIAGKLTEVTKANPGH
ncbi:hypothetical protein ABGF38_00700 [Helcococcus ovis]|uniref:Flp family type IVb pilin n=1 Tax=Helcococcus ovis TaxID=72026 RepID=UPI0038B6CDF5